MTRVKSACAFPIWQAEAEPALSTAARKRQKVAEASEAYGAAELEGVIEAQLSRLFAGQRDDCSFDELLEALRAFDARAATVTPAAVTAVLESLEGANKVRADCA